jgi:hypothetical protein
MVVAGGEFDRGKVDNLPAEFQQGVLLSDVGRLPCFSRSRRRSLRTAWTTPGDGWNCPCNSRHTDTVRIVTPQRARTRKASGISGLCADRAHCKYSNAIRLPYCPTAGRLRNSQRRCSTQMCIRRGHRTRCSFILPSTNLDKGNGPEDRAEVCALSYGTMLHSLLVPACLKLGAPRCITSTGGLSNCTYRDEHAFAPSLRPICCHSSPACKRTARLLAPPGLRDRGLFEHGCLSLLEVQVLSN